MIILWENNQASLIVITSIVFLLIARTIGRRLVYDYLLWKQAPWSVLFKIIAGMLLVSSSSLILGKWKGGGNFIFKFVSMYLGIDTLINTLVEGCYRDRCSNSSTNGWTVLRKLGSVTWIYPIILFQKWEKIKGR